MACALACVHKQGRTGSGFKLSAAGALLLRPVRGLLSVLRSCAGCGYHCCLQPMWHCMCVLVLGLAGQVCRICEAGAGGCFI